MAPTRPTSMLGRVSELTSRYTRAFGVRNALAFAWIRFRKSPARRTTTWHGRTVHFRPGTTDFGTYMQVLYWPEYDVALGRAPEVIVDAGANIGLSVLWFADCYPNARIIAIEPEPDNFALLQMNTAELANVSCVRAALWSSNDDVVISDPGSGTWGFQTSAGGGGGGAITAPGLTIDDLFDRFDLERINLLKIDIEGAERDVFASRPAELGRIDVIAIELHDGLHPGCSEAFFSAVDGELGTRHTSGEHVYVFRDGWAPAPSGAPRI